MPRPLLELTLTLTLLPRLCLTAPIVRMQAVLPEHAPYHGYAAGDVIGDHDVALAYVLEHDVEALPCVAALPPAQLAAVRFALGKIHYNHGHLVQAEAPPGALFSHLKDLIHAGGASASDVAFYLVHWLTDLAGAQPSPLRGAAHHD